jgi:RNA polymerase primary sigma factor
MKFEPSRELTTYFKELEGKNHPLTPDEVKHLIPLAQAGDKEAITRVINSCSKLIVKTANHYMKQGVPVMDLVQEGNLGAIEAITRYKIGGGSTFVSYARLWIRKYINDSVATVGRTVRFPMNKEFEIFKLKKSGKDAGNFNNISIDKPVTDGGSLNTLDLHGSCVNSAETKHDLEYTKALANEFLSTIQKSRDKEIIKAYFGIGRDVALCGEDLQTEFGINKTQISQIVTKTIKNLQDAI